jgi:hypothetical protein
MRQLTVYLRTWSHANVDYDTVITVKLTTAPKFVHDHIVLHYAENYINKVNTFQ